MISSKLRHKLDEIFGDTKYCKTILAEIYVRESHQFKIQVAKICNEIGQDIVRTVRNENY